MSRSRFFNKKESPKQQEESFADKIGGYRRKMSGAYRSSGGGWAGPGHKGDVVTKDFSIECKQTGHRSISISTKWLETITKGAIPQGKKPMVHIMFENIDPLCSKKWILVEEEVFLGMMNHED